MVTPGLSAAAKREGQAQTLAQELAARPQLLAYPTRAALLAANPPAPFLAFVAADEIIGTSALLARYTAGGPLRWIADTTAPV